VMAAAVADYRPAAAKEQKIKKTPGREDLSVELVRNPDIIAGIDRPGMIKIGFAAETERLLEHAAAKLEAKGLAMIVANDAVSTIGSDISTATFIFPGRSPEVLTGMPKDELAGVIMERITSLLISRQPERVRP
jgi:phosphopantothenoylcysteine decarboxylase / phosphopantothenate---cysteine ligase